MECVSSIDVVLDGIFGRCKYKVIVNHQVMGKARAIQVSVFSSSPGLLTPSPLAGEGWDGGEKRGIRAPPVFTPTLALPRRGGGKRLTDTDPEN
jgi:hypothetical protein